MKYKIAERFKSLQGEGLYTGTPMAFIRFVGCSVGKRICQHCDTDFDKMGPEFRGGGEIEGIDLLVWSRPYQHVCLTGGEPLDQDLRPLITSHMGSLVKGDRDRMFHIETSGTIPIPDYLSTAYICVSPKPGFLEEVVMAANEVKVIVPGLGTITSAQIDERITKLYQPGYQGEFEDYAKKFRWPDLSDALRWAEKGKTVFLQPRNGKFDIDYVNLMYVTDVLKEHPNLRLSTQAHKILKVQ